MPAKHVLSDTEKGYLKKICEHTAGFPLQDTYSCSQLSDLIQTKTGKTISYNTLRRVFGIINTKNSPSEYSLNVLVHFLGFENWAAFILYLHKQENEQFLLKNHSFIHFGLLDMPWIKEFVSRLSKLEWQDAFKLKSLVQAAIYRRDEELLLILTDLPLSDQDHPSMQRLILAYEPIIWEAIHAEEIFWKWIGGILQKRLIFRKVILEFYVNEDALDGYYGYWLNLPFEQVTEEFVLFRKLVNGQMAYSSGVDTHSFEGEISEAIDHGLWKTHHPIIKGRIAAWAVLFGKIGKPELTAMCDSCEHWYGKAAFTTFFYRLFWVGSQASSFEDWNWEGSPLNLGMLSTFEFSQWNNYLLVQAVFAQKRQNHVKAKETFDKIDKFLFAFDRLTWFHQQYESCEKFLREYQEHGHES